MIEVNLTETEVAICTYIGKLRNRVTGQRAPDRMQDKTQDGVDISIRGVMSEYAVAKALDLFFDLNCDYRQFGADLVSKKGKTIDVKCAFRSGGSLNAVRWSDSKPVDLYILTELHVTTVKIIGYIRSRDFLVPENLIDVGNGEFFSVPQDRLIPFKP